MRKLIRTDGSEVDLPEPVTFKQVYDLIGCDCVDTVTLADGVHVMLVDDNGLLTGQPLNEKATLLYSIKCGGRNTTPIVGNVVIVPDADYGD